MAVDMVVVIVKIDDYECLREGMKEAIESAESLDTANAHPSPYIHASLRITASPARSEFDLFDTVPCHTCLVFLLRPRRR
jgi:hypothetical protein